MATPTQNLVRPAFRTPRALRLVGYPVVAAEAAAHAARALAVALVDVPAGYPVTDPVAVTVASAVGALGAAALHAALRRWTRRPARNLVVVSTVALLLSFGSATGLSGMFPGIAPAAVAVSPLLHTVVAAASVGASLAAARR